MDASVEVAAASNDAPQLNAAGSSSSGRARVRRSDSARRLAKHIQDGDVRNLRDLRDDDGQQVLRHRQKSVAVEVAGAATMAEVTTPEPVQLEVRFSWLHVHSVDTEEQEFTAEFFVDARVRGRSDLVPRADDSKSDAATRWTPALYIANMCDGELIRGEDAVHGVDASYRRHWRGCFKQEFQLHEFPFDIQDFHLLLVEHSHDRTVTMVPDEQLPSIFHVNSFTLGNVWSLLGIHNIAVPTAFSSLQVSMRRLELHVERSHTDPSESARAQAFPMLKAGLFMRRQSTAYCWNIIAPMFVMTSMCYVVSELPCDELNDRLSNGLALLLAAVAYKFVAAQGLPTLSYLTLLDKYVMVCFLFITLMVGLNWLVVSIDGPHCAERLDPILLKGWLYSWGAVNLVMMLVVVSTRMREHKGVQLLELNRKPSSAHLQLHECVKHGPHAGSLHAGHSDVRDGSGGGVSAVSKERLASRHKAAAAVDEPLMPRHQAGSRELSTINGCTRHGSE